MVITGLNGRFKINFNYNLIAQVVTETLSGITAGTIELTINGVSYTQAYSTSAGYTAASFYTAHVSALDTAGITLTNPSAGALRFEAQYNRVSHVFVETSAGTDGTWTQTNNDAERFLFSNLPDGNKRKITLWIDTRKGLSPPVPMWEEYDALELGISPIEGDTFSAEFDDINFFLPSKEYDVTFADANDNLANLLFNLRLINDGDESVKVEYQKNELGQDGYFKYTGYLYQDSTAKEWAGTKEFKCKFSPSTNKLNTTPTSIGGVFNPITGLSWGDSDPKLVSDVILYILRIVNPNITIDVFQDWTFRRDLNGTMFDVAFDELYVNWKRLFAYADWTLIPNKTYFDVLKSLIFDMGCLGGFESDDHAFMKIFYPDFDTFSDYYVVNTEEIISYSDSRNKNKIKYLVLTADSANYATAGTDTGLQQETLDLEIFPDIFYIYCSGAPYVMQQIMNSVIAFHTREEFEALYWAQYYLNEDSVVIDRTKEVEIELRENNLTFANLIKFRNEILFPLKIVTDHWRNITTVKGVPIGSY